MDCRYSYFRSTFCSANVVNGRWYFHNQFDNDESIKTTLLECCLVLDKVRIQYKLGSACSLEACIPFRVCRHHKRDNSRASLAGQCEVRPYGRATRGNNITYRWLPTSNNRQVNAPWLLPAWHNKTSLSPARIFGYIDWKETLYVCSYCLQRSHKYFIASDTRFTFSLDKNVAFVKA